MTDKNKPVKKTSGKKTSMKKTVCRIPPEVERKPRIKKGLPNIQSSPGIKIPNLPNRYILRLNWKERRAIRGKIQMLLERLKELKSMVKNEFITEEDRQHTKDGILFAQGEIQIMRLAEKEHLSAEEITKLETVLVDESYDNEVLQKLKKDLRSRVTAY
jgi:hypothetical protein